MGRAQRWRGFVVGGAVALALALAGSAATAVAAPAGFTLSTTRPGGPGFAPAFVGNGYLAGRQPAAGQGFATVAVAGGDPLPTQSEVQGLYARVTQKDTGLIERRAALPAWSTLVYDDGSGGFSLRRGRVRAYQQSLDLHTGTLATRIAWTSPGGRTVLLRFDVTPDRAHPHAALVRLRVTPAFSGRIDVTDVLEGRAAEWTRAVARGHGRSAQYVDLRTRGIGVRATLASVLAGPGRLVAVAPRDPQTVAQRRSLRVRRGQTLTWVKHVGVAVGTDHGVRGRPHERAVRAAEASARRGYVRARGASDRAWAALWRADIRVDGAPRLQREVRAAHYALLASLRGDVPWAPSPGGLSSDGYNGHVFWDSETWMYPSLLATAPAIARQMLAYRVARLRPARANARRTGFRGARFPWESALSGAEETPSCCNTGKYEVHVNADVVLAAWQYWLATGDRGWLRRSGWPLVSQVADFWVSRARRNADGSWSIRKVIPPDEYAEGVNDSVYTNLTTRDALRIAARVASLVGRAPKPIWARVAGHLRIGFDRRRGIHPEYHGYPGDTVKQADVTLLSYPWENAQTAAVTRADLDYYVPRTDPGGPSMTDAIHSILSAQLGTPGCAAYTFTVRSVDPFMRGPYAQFSESRSGGAFTFTTGAGGFLQEFLYGYSGLRWRADRLRLAPSLPPQLRGITLSRIHWRGRTLRVVVRRGTTTVTLLAGRALSVDTPGGISRVAPGRPLALPTSRPDEAPTTDLARCRPVGASAATAEPPEAAVDGTVATSWLGERRGTSLRVDLGRAVALGAVTLDRPGVLALPARKEGDPAKTRRTRSAAERVEVSVDGRHWTLLAAVARPPRHERFAGTGSPVRYVRVTTGAGAAVRHPLVIGELGVTAAP